VASGKRGGQHFGVHTLRLTQLFPVIYSTLTFKKKILTRRTHTPSSSLNYLFTGLRYCLYNPFIGWIREEFERIERFREEIECHIHTPYTHAVLTRRIHTPYTHAVLTRCIHTPYNTRRTHTPSSSFNYPFTGLSYCLCNPFIGQKR